MAGEPPAGGPWAGRGGAGRGRGRGRGLLNVSAYKALHPTWNQEPDLLHLAEGLEEHCQEGL